MLQEQWRLFQRFILNSQLELFLVITYVFSCVCSNLFFFKRGCRWSRILYRLSLYTLSSQICSPLSSPVVPTVFTSPHFCCPPPQHLLFLSLLSSLSILSPPINPIHFHPALHYLRFSPLLLLLSPLVTTFSSSSSSSPPVQISLLCLSHLSFLSHTLRSCCIRSIRGIDLPVSR